MIYVTGGEFRGRPIRTPKGDRTRPSQARLRQALFNSIQTVIADAKVLDLYSGSGALGIEALSRGAASVVFVETAKEALKVLEGNVAEFGVKDRTSVISGKVESSLEKLKARAPFDLVLADPPYALGVEITLLNELPWGELLTPDGIFCLEWSPLKAKVTELPDETHSLKKIREKNYGDSLLTHFQRLRDAQS